MQTPKFTNHLYSARRLLAHLHAMQVNRAVQHETWVIIFTGTTIIWCCSVLHAYVSREMGSNKEMKLKGLIALHTLFSICFYRTNSPHLVGWVCSDFQHQFAHKGIMKIQQYFLVGNFKGGGLRQGTCFKPPPLKSLLLSMAQWVWMARLALSEITSGQNVSKKRCPQKEATFLGYCIKNEKIWKFISWQPQMLH